MFLKVLNEIILGHFPHGIEGAVKLPPGGGGGGRRNVLSDYAFTKSYLLTNFGTHYITPTVIPPLGSSHHRIVKWCP